MKLSIITINYNNLNGLKRTVESVVAQTWKDFEYIIIDGGSTDGSAEFISENKIHFAYWVSESDKGIYNAMNKGILQANGEYYLFLNSGDLLYSNEVLFIAHKELHTDDLICFDLIFRGNDDVKSTYPNKINFSYLLGSSLGHPSIFMKKNLFRNNKYDESLKFASDWKFFLLALFKFNSTYRKVDNVLSIFYMDGISSKPCNEQLIYKERQCVLKNDFRLIYEEMLELKNHQSTLNLLKSSRKIKYLLKLRVINKF
jgi:glycosyltransferase involved in cell wall biosynthesis